MIHDQVHAGQCQAPELVLTETIDSGYTHYEASYRAGRSVGSSLHDEY